MAVRAADEYAQRPRDAVPDTRNPHTPSMNLLAPVSTLLLLAPLAADKLAFGPKEGTELEKKFHITVALEKQSLSMTIGGQELPKEMLDGATMTVEMEQTVTVRDAFKKMEDGKPLELEREYVELESKQSSEFGMPGMPEPQVEEKDKPTKLEGKTVVFTWDAKAEEYAKKWSGDGAGDELLEKLEEDMDLRVLLGDGSADVGESWTLEGEDLDALLDIPGGDFGFEDDDEENDDDFGDNLKGRATLTYKGAEEVGGRRVARITIEGNATTHVDVAEDGGTGKMEFSLEFRGEALWSLDGLHLVSQSIECDLTMKLEMEQDIDAGGGEQTLVMRAELAGTMKSTVGFAKP